MRFIHMADIHLGAKPDKGYGWSREREKEIYTSFYAALEKARRERVDLVLISGDLFQTPPTHKQLQEINTQFAKLSPIKIVYIAGEHDFVEPDSASDLFSFSSNIIFLRDVKKQTHYIEEIDTWVYGISYDRGKITAPMYDELIPEGEEGIHILLAHGGDREHSPMDFEKLKWSGFDYVALGHRHTPQTLVEDLMTYSGSLEPLDPTEEGEHGYMYGEITEEKRIVQFISHAKRKYISFTIKVSLEMTTEEISDKIEEEILNLGEENFYTIILEGNFEGKLDLSYFELDDRYRILSIVNQTKVYESLDLLYEQNKDNILGSLILERKKEDISQLEEDALEYAIEALLCSRQ